MKNILHQIVFVCLTVFFNVSLVFAAAAQQDTLQSYFHPAMRLLFFGTIVTIWGLYKSKKERIVVFANLTDVLVTLSTFIIPLVLYILCLLMGFKGKPALGAILIIGFVIWLYVIKATWAYNRSIGAGFFNFLHALVTKYCIVGIYIVAMLAIFQYGGAARRRNERAETWHRRADRNRAVAYGAASIIFAIMTFLGLWTQNFVSLGAYSTGAWEDAVEESDSEEHSEERE